MDIISRIKTIEEGVKLLLVRIETIGEKLDTLSGSVELVEKQLNKKSKDRFVPTFKSGPTFTEFIEQMQKYVMISIDDIQFAKSNGYVKGIAEIIIRYIKSFEPEITPIKIIDKKNKKFYIKVKDCWSTNLSFNIEAFDSLVANLCIHFLDCVYKLQLEHPEVLDIVLSTNIINSFLTHQKKHNFAKSVRFRCIKML